MDEETLNVIAFLTLCLLLKDFTFERGAGNKRKQIKISKIKNISKMISNTVRNDEYIFTIFHKQYRSKSNIWNMLKNFMTQQKL